MVVNLVMFLLIVAVIYVFAYPDSQLAETTSALGQIWSGSCRLSCRHSEYSGFSGLSGLVPGNSYGNKGCILAQASYQGPSGCVCASCPCALIENVLRTCRPVTTMYSSAVQFLANVYYAVLEALSEMYNYVEQILNCHASCQRPQLVENSDSASETIFFGKHKDSTEKLKDKPRKSDPGLRASRSIVFKDLSDSIAKKRDESSSTNAPGNLNNANSNATIKPRRENEKSKKEKEDTKPMFSGTSNSCPKCVEQGKICMKDCPKAMKKMK